MWTRKKLLIIAKTYPEFSKSHLETVCTAAIDGETGRLIRVYPMSLRYMERQPQAFEWIEADVEKNPKDFRPESYRIRQDTVTILDSIGTEHGWSDRSAWVLKGSNEFKSAEELHAANKVERTSLGLVRPKVIDEVYAVQKTHADLAQWNEKRERAVSQHELFGDDDVEVRELKFPWIEYRARFHCDDANCNGHDMSVHDWGIYVLDMKMTEKYGTADAEQKVLDKMKDLLDPEKHDTRLLLGNTLMHPGSFFIGGLYYPPRHQQGAFAFLQMQDRTPARRTGKQLRKDRSMAIRRVSLEAEKGRRSA